MKEVVHMKLSILDPSSVSQGQTSRQALDVSRQLAVLADKWGYTRYWMTEHHGMSGFASSAPEVLLSYMGAHTAKIRLGTGAVLLPYYKPYKVAEVHCTLASLFPDRIDLGIGRAPGGPAEASLALSDHYLQQVWHMPEHVKELLDFLYSPVQGKPAVFPVPPVAPQAWLLGTSEKSASLAAEQGMFYAYADFMSENNGAEIVQHYRDHFKSSEHHASAHVIVAVSAVCADTSEKAEDIAWSGLVWSIQKEKGEGDEGVPSIEEARAYSLNEGEAEKIAKMKDGMIIGTPSEVVARLRSIQTLHQADEMMIITTTYLAEDKLRSYELIAKKVLKEHSFE